MIFRRLWSLDARARIHPKLCCSTAFFNVFFFFFLSLFSLHASLVVIFAVHSRLPHALFNSLIFAFFAIFNNVVKQQNLYKVTREHEHTGKYGNFIVWQTVYMEEIAILVLSYLFNCSINDDGNEKKEKNRGSVNRFIPLHVSLGVAYKYEILSLFLMRFNSACESLFL